MSVQLTEDQRMARAKQAERIINDPLYVEAFSAVRNAILDKFEQSPVRDAEGREHLFKMLKALTDAKGYLEQMVQDGQVLIHLQKQRGSFLNPVKRLFKYR